ncbi:MAG: GNAT family N-acetyltransferase [Saprospiraceae bacterium]|nr:GNAT family N-acetyltransferase [Bacteroidia bacterium]NNE15209.1 GNAT family N-acetyltransferase [Saprospiraceae bacterium]NNL93234.1 GNAT family N-acetyltransferase [Saprospiraceae bacterium]
MVFNSFNISQSTLDDLDVACWLYQDAIKYQKEKGFPLYKTDDRHNQERHIKNGCHFKVTSNNKIIAIFNIQHQDPLVWGIRDKGDAFYLHGVLVHSQFKGKKIFKFILDWVINYAKSNNRQIIRLDTWADNPPLENYYKKHEFKVIGHVHIPDAEEISPNCRNNRVVLMEYTI